MVMLILCCFCFLIILEGKRAFRIRTRRTATTLGLPYDYNSAMHYGMFHMTKNRRPTILPRDRSITRLGGRSLSPLDIFKANVLYNCLGKLSVHVSKSFRTSLIPQTHEAIVLYSVVVLLPLARMCITVMFILPATSHKRYALKPGFHKGVPVANIAAVVEKR